MQAAGLTTILSIESLPKCETCPADNRLPGEHLCLSPRCKNTKKYYCERCQKTSSRLHDTHKDTKTVHIIEDVGKEWTDLYLRTEQLYNVVDAKYKTHEQLILSYESHRATIIQP